MRHVVLSVALALTVLHTTSATAVAEPVARSGNIWISGEVPPSVWVGDRFVFRPAVYLRNGGVPTRYGVISLPSWARFGADGTISGTPGPGDVGSHLGIHVVVYAGAEYAMFGPLSVEVRDPATSPRVTLSWQRPLQNVDGSALTDLSGYSVLAARSGRVLVEVQRVTDPSLSRVVVDRLDPGTWFFQVKTLNTLGLESAPTRMVWKQVK